MHDQPTVRKKNLVIEIIKPSDKTKNSLIKNNKILTQTLVQIEQIENSNHTNKPSKSETNQDDDKKTIIVKKSNSPPAKEQNILGKMRKIFSYFIGVRTVCENCNSVVSAPINTFDSNINTNPNERHRVKNQRSLSRVYENRYQKDVEPSEAVYHHSTFQVHEVSHETYRHTPLNRQQIENIAQQERELWDLNTQVTKAAANPGLHSDNKEQHQLANAFVGLVAHEADLVSSYQISGATTHIQLKEDTWIESNTISQVTSNVDSVAASHKVTASQSNLRPKASRNSKKSKKITHLPLSEDNLQSMQTDLPFSNTSRPKNNSYLSNTEQMRSKRDIEEVKREATDTLSETNDVTNEISSPPLAEITQRKPSYSNQKAERSDSAESSEPYNTSDESDFSRKRCSSYGICEAPFNFTATNKYLYQLKEEQQKHLEQEKKELEILIQKNTFEVWPGGSGGLYVSFTRTFEVRETDEIKNCKYNIAYHQRMIDSISEQIENLKSVVIAGNQNWKEAWRKQLEKIASVESELTQVNIQIQFDEDILRLNKKHPKKLMSSRLPIPLMRGDSIDEIEAKLEILREKKSSLSKTIAELKRDHYFSLKLFDDPSAVVIPAFDTNNRLPTDLDSESAAIFLDQYINITNKDIDSLLIETLKIYDINLTPEQLNENCTIGFRHKFGGRSLPVTTEENVTLKKLLLGDAHRETSSFPNIRLTQVQLLSGSFTEKQLEKLNSLFKDRQSLLSVSDNIMQSSRKIADELKVRMNKEPIKRVFETFLNYLVFNHIMNYSTTEKGNTYFQDEIQRAFFSGVLKPEPLLYNGEIVPNIITLGVGDYRFIMSMNTKEIFFYSPYEINENLSAFILSNLLVKQRDSIDENSLGASKKNKLKVVKDQLVKIQTIEPSSKISFGFLDKENGYQDFFHVIVEGILDKINSLTFENKEFKAKTLYEILSLLLFITPSIAPPAVGAAVAGTSAAVKVVSTILVEITQAGFTILKAKGAKENADRPEDRDAFENEIYSTLVLSLPNIIFAGFNIKTAPVTRTKQVVKDFIMQNLDVKQLTFGLKNRGFIELSKNAVVKPVIKHSKLPKEVRKACPYGACNGMNLETIMRIDKSDNEIKTILESTTSITADLNSKNPQIKEVIQSIINKQNNPKFVAFNNFDKSAPKRFSATIPQATEEFRTFIDTLSDRDIYNLRVYIMKANNEINEMGHMLTFQKIDDGTVQLFDINNAVFIYPNKDAFKEAITGYFGSAYSETGISYPGAVDIYTRKTPDRAGAQAGSSAN